MAWLGPNNKKVRLTQTMFKGLVFFPRGPAASGWRRPGTCSRAGPGAHNEIYQCTMCLKLIRIIKCA